MLKDIKVLKYISSVATRLVENILYSKLHTKNFFNKMCVPNLASGKSFLVTFNFPNIFKTKVKASVFYENLSI